jgi:hypothetical protein
MKPGDLIQVSNKNGTAIWPLSSFKLLEILPNNELLIFIKDGAMYIEVLSKLGFGRVHRFYVK